MDKKKILIVSRVFYPNNSPRSFRTTELATELSRQGHEVVVCFPFENFDYTEYSKQTNLVLKNLGPLKFKPIKLSGTKPILLIKKVIQRALMLLIEYPEIELFFRINHVLKHEKGYDLLISIAAPHTVHWGTEKSFRKNPALAKTWIADCGDPYMGVELETFRKPFYFKYFEKRFCRRANYITVPTSGAIDAYYPEFKNKIKVIPQGFKFDEIKIQDIHNPVINFAYAGSIAIKGVRNPLLVLEYLLNVKEDFRFHIFADHSNGFLNKYKELLGEKLILHDKLDRQNLISFLCNMDFLINLYNGTKKQLPSKLIDYALARRPILNIYPLNPDYKIINQFLHRDYRAQYQITDLEQYNIVNVAKKFMALTEI